MLDFPVASPFFSILSGISITSLIFRLIVGFTILIIFELTAEFRNAKMYAVSSRMFGK